MITFFLQNYNYRKKSFFFCNTRYQNENEKILLQDFSIRAQRKWQMLMWGQEQLFAVKQSSLAMWQLVMFCHVTMILMMTGLWNLGESVYFASDHNYDEGSFYWARKEKVCCFAHLKYCDVINLFIVKTCLNVIVVILGGGTIIHPKARIAALAGPIIIGLICSQYHQ